MVRVKTPDGQPHPSLADNDIATVVKPTDNSFYILGKREGLTDVILTDRRSGRNQTIRVPVSVEFPGVGNLISGDDDISRREPRHWRGADLFKTGTVYATIPVIINIDSRVNVRSFTWNVINGVIARSGGGAGGARTRVSEVNNNSRSLVVELIDDGGGNGIDDVNPFTKEITFTIFYGAAGDEEYEGSFLVTNDPF